MRPFGAWFGRLAMAGTCLLGAGCGGGDIPDPDSDSHAASADQQRRGPAIREQAPAEPEPKAEEIALASNTAPAKAEEPAPAREEKPAEAEKPAPAPSKGDSSGTDEMLKTPAKSGSDSPGSSTTNDSPAPAPSAPGQPPRAGDPAPTAPTTPDAPGLANRGRRFPGMANPNGPTPPAGAPSAPSVPGGQPAAPGAQPGVPGGQAYPGMAGTPPGAPGAAPAAPGMAPGGLAGSDAAAGGGMRDMRPGGPGAPGAPGGPGASPGGQGQDALLTGSKAFNYPNTAVMAFLAALKAKDKDRLAQCVARRAPIEADEKHRKIFSAILDQSISDDELDELAKSLENYQVMSFLPATSSARIGVLISKMENPMDRLQRTVTTRKEKEGWKVLDVEKALDFKMIRMPTRGRRR